MKEDQEDKIVTMSNVTYPWLSVAHILLRNG